MLSMGSLSFGPYRNQRSYYLFKSNQKISVNFIKMSFVEIVDNAWWY